MCGNWQPVHFHSGFRRSYNKALAAAQIPLHSLLSQHAAENHLRKVTWVGEPNAQVPTFLSRSHSEFWAIAQVTTTVPPGVSETLGDPREGGQTSLFLRTHFLLYTAPAHMISPGSPKRQKKDPELAGASSPDNLSALIERQRVSGEWLYRVGIDFSSLCLCLVSVSFGGGYCYYKQHESCLC